MRAKTSWARVKLPHTMKSARCSPCRAAKVISGIGHQAAGCVSSIPLGRQAQTALEVDYLFAELLEVLWIPAKHTGEQLDTRGAGAEQTRNLRKHDVEIGPAIQSKLELWYRTYLQFTRIAAALAERLAEGLNACCHFLSRFSRGSQPSPYSAMRATFLGVRAIPRSTGSRG